MPKLIEQAPKRLSDEEVELILRHTPLDKQLCFKLALLTACRFTELQNLRWTDYVELPQPHLVIQKTKNGQVRRIPLVREAVKLLSQERLVNKSPFIIRWRAKGAGSVVHWIRKRSGHETFHFHMLRHTAATRLLEAGAGLSTVPKICGHKCIQVTERYARLSDRAVFAEVERLDSAGGIRTQARS